LTGTPDATEDCLPYYTGSLQIVEEPGRWLLTDGFQRMFVLDSADDAANALALARRYARVCYIGRDNRRADRAAYILNYWKDRTPLATTIQPEDCDAYTVSNLRIEDQGAAGWAVMDGKSRLLLLDTESDATVALGVARQHGATCFIGRGNRRPDPRQFIVRYWK
jgi:hypothetical protein